MRGDRKGNWRSKGVWEEEEGGGEEGNSEEEAEKPETGDGETGQPHPREEKGPDLRGKEEE